VASSFACLLIVAAIHAHLSAAAAIAEDVPVPGGVASLAQSLGIDPAPDRARFMSEITRLVYEMPEIRNPAVTAFLQALRQNARDKSGASVRAAAATSESVPVPLTTEIWSSAIFRRKLTPDALVLAIVADRQAAWLCHGLSKLDDETLQFFAAHPSLLTRIYQRSAPFFAAFGASIRIRDNRVVPPGDAGAVALWEGAVDERVARADRFVVSLLESADGRIAYLYHVAANLDAPRQAFMLGSWMPPAMRSERFRLLTTAGVAAMREWHVRLLPFARASFDFAMALLRLSVRDDGTPMPPASRALWSRVVGAGDTDDRPIDAAWILQYLVSTDVRQRGERLDTVAFAQRLVAEQSAASEDLESILRMMPRQRALMLALERTGLRSQSTYAAVVKHAARLASLDGRKGYVVQAQFQGALAIVARLMTVGTIDRTTGDRLLGQLAALPVADGYAGGVARWISASLHPVLPATQDVESALVAGASGPRAQGNLRVTWEGQQYRLDLAAAERQRLERVREKQHAPRIDVPLQMAAAAHQLTTEKVSVEDLQDSALQFEALATDLPERSREEETDSVPAGVGAPASPHEVLRRAIEELTRAAKNKDVKRAPKIAESIVELADDLLARNLLSFVYALSIGDPEGTVLLANDVSHRHDFGFGVKDPDVRGRVTWSLPRQEVAPGVPWHMSGSLLGLDAGLATLALRRVVTDHVLEAPKLTNNARETFATSVALMDPYALRDEDRDAIAEAVARGTARAAVATDAAGVDAIAADIGLDAARRRALLWTLAHEPDRTLSIYSLTELLVLGGGDIRALEPWGMAVIPSSGCLCSRLLPPGAWSLLAGRPQLGLEAAVLPDLNLQVAIVLSELRLPAALAKVILSGAMQDFIDESRPTDDGDWLSLSREARQLTRERTEDYIAAATATGPLMPEPTRSPQP
jgi:hypothetical protein